MASRDIVVTVGEDDWLTLNDAAECAGMSVEAYVSWGVWLLALQARLGTGASKMRLRASGLGEESETVAWTETFAQRLSAHGDRQPPDTELWM
ncbi:hypothetical protein ACIRRA_44785 [Nocardia sp. NPDC101769]|uniref:hypothetical protein n=1 Tax=Nocardia sp. NPDC101769 TaxID=3364333 RepID=UPI0037F3707E